jgi:hypothetical protein
MEQQQEKMTFRKAVKKAVESYSIGERFYGYDLKDKVVDIYPKCTNCYVETFLREARKVARDKYICVDRTKGQYERV